MARSLRAALFAALIVSPLGCGCDAPPPDPIEVPPAPNLELTDEALLRLCQVEGAVRAAGLARETARRQRGEALGQIRSERFAPGPLEPDAAAIARELGFDPDEIEVTRRQVRELALVRWSATDRATTQRFRDVHLANLERRRATVEDAEQRRDLELSIAEIQAGVRADADAEAHAARLAPQLSLVDRYADELGALWPAAPAPD